MASSDESTSVWIIVVNINMSYNLIPQSFVYYVTSNYNCQLLIPQTLLKHLNHKLMSLIPQTGYHRLITTQTVQLLKQLKLHFSKSSTIINSSTKRRSPKRAKRNARRVPRSAFRFSQRPPRSSRGGSCAFQEDIYGRVMRNLRNWLNELVEWSS